MPKKENVCKNCVYRIPNQDVFDCNMGYDLIYEDISVTGCPEFVAESKYHTATDGLPSNDDGFY